MLVTKLKMQSSPYGDSVIFAQTEHLKLKEEKTKKTSTKFLTPLSTNLLQGSSVLCEQIKACVEKRGQDCDLNQVVLRGACLDRRQQWKSV